MDFKRAMLPLVGVLAVGWTACPPPQRTQPFYFGLTAIKATSGEWRLMPYGHGFPPKSTQTLYVLGEPVREREQFVATREWRALGKFTVGDGGEVNAGGLAPVQTMAPNGTVCLPTPPPGINPIFYASDDATGVKHFPNPVAVLPAYFGC